MKFKVFDRVEEIKKEVYFRLSDEDGDIKLVACDNEGTWLWDILSIRSDGTLTRWGSIGKEIGLELDDEGKIKETD